MMRQLKLKVEDSQRDNITLQEKIKEINLMLKNENEKYEELFKKHRDLLKLLEGQNMNEKLNMVNKLSQNPQNKSIDEKSKSLIKIDNELEEKIQEIEDLELKNKNLQI